MPLLTVQLFMPMIGVLQRPSSTPRPPGTRLTSVVITKKKETHGKAPIMYERDKKVICFNKLTMTTIEKKDVLE